ncbi:hypothetical protein B0H19DRAFT_1082870 [Mycena capillaripes]|nr:hypothetical protein B0H19DRAFT_1082870 [Mycena capillaripes]
MYAERKHIKSLTSITFVSARAVPQFKAGPKNEALFCLLFTIPTFLHLMQRVFSPIFGALNCRITWLPNSQPVPSGFEGKLSGGAAGSDLLLSIAADGGQGIMCIRGVSESGVFDATGEIGPVSLYFLKHRRFRCVLAHRSALNTHVAGVQSRGDIFFRLSTFHGIAKGSSRLGTTQSLLNYNFRDRNRPGGLTQLTIRCDSANKKHIDDLFLGMANPDVD